MKANTLIYFIGICMLSSQANNNYGQDSEPQGTIQEAEFIVKKEKKNEIPEAARLFKKAALPPAVDQPSLQLKYELDNLPMNFQPLNHKIKILRAKQDRLERLYGNYVRLGYGNSHRPYLAALFNNTRSAKYAYGLQLEHISEGKNAHAEEYHQLAGLHGKMFTDKLVLKGVMDYMWDKHPFIQVIGDPQNTANDPERHHTYHQIGVSTQLYNYVPDKLNYEAKIQALHLHQADVHENYGKASCHVDYQLNEALQLHADTRLQLSQYTDPPSASMIRHMVSLHPSLVTSFQGFTIQAGANAAYQNDKKALPNNFYVHPAIKLTYELNKTFRPYIELSGGIQPHVWQTHVSQNPWLTHSPDLRYTNQSFILSLGAQSDIIETLTCHGGISISSYQNYSCFVNNEAEPRKFDIQYDSSTTVINGFTELTKTSFEAALVTRLKAAYFYYNLTDLPKPWHKPQYNLELYNTYSFHDKVLVKSNLFWKGGIEALDPNTQISKALADIIDLSLGVEYLWNKRFSIFLDCQNILAKSNNQYLHTPTSGTRIMLGITYGW